MRIFRLLKPSVCESSRSNDHFTSQSVLLPLLEELLQVCHFFQVDKRVDKLFQIILVILKIQNAIFHERSNELSCHFCQFALVLVVVWALLNVLYHEQTESKSNVLWNFHNFVQSRKRVNGVDSQRRVQKSLQVISNDWVIAKFAHKHDWNVRCVLDNLHQHFRCDSQIQYGVRLNFQGSFNLWALFFGNVLFWSFFNESFSFGKFFFNLGAVIPVDISNDTGWEPVKFWGMNVNKVRNWAHESNIETLIGNVAFLNGVKSRLCLRRVEFFVFFIKIRNYVLNCTFFGLGNLS